MYSPMLLTMLFIELKKLKPSIDAFKELVEGIPDSLNFKEDAALLYPDAVKYIPILAQEGVKHEVAEESAAEY